MEKVHKIYGVFLKNQDYKEITGGHEEDGFSKDFGRGLRILL